MAPLGDVGGPLPDEGGGPAIALGALHLLLGHGDAPRSPEPGVFSGGINASNGRACHRRRRAPGTSRPHRLRRLVDLHLGVGAIGTYRNARTPPSAQLYAMSADGAGRGGGAELSAAGALGGTGHCAAVAPGPRRSPRRTRRASGYASG